MTEVIGSVGKRKTSIARIYMKPGTGVMTINNRPFDVYFIRPIAKMLAQETLKLTEQDQKWDVMVNVNGGGLMGQAGAIRHAISKALAELDRTKYRGVLKKGGFLTRDSRIKERKKYGQKAARAKFQFSKR